MDEATREEFEWLVHHESGKWKIINGELVRKGTPTAIKGGFAGLEVVPPPLTLATVTVTATEGAIWPVATWTPIAAYTQAPTAYRLAAFGTLTTAATPGTMQIVPRIGTTNAGIALGATVTAAQTASQTTTVWRIWGDLIIRIGGGASTATAVGSFRYSQGTATTGGSAVLPAIEQIFGGTVASYDGSTAQGLYMGAVAVTSTTNTYIPQGVIWSSWN